MQVGLASNVEILRFRRNFFARWLVANWLTPIGLCVLTVLAVALQTEPEESLRLSWLSSYLPVVFWLSVAAANAWAMTGTISQPVRWAAATLLAGFIAMLCLLYGAGLSPTNHVPRLLLDDLFYLVGPRSLPTSTTTCLVVAGGMFGLIMGGTQTFLLWWHGSHRIAWTIVNVIAGIVSFGWLGPLDWRLRNEMFDRFGIDLPVVLRTSFYLVTGPLALFIVGWLTYALITGLALKRFLVRIGNSQAAQIAESFD